MMTPIVARKSLDATPMFCKQTVLTSSMMSDGILSNISLMLFFSKSPATAATSSAAEREGSDVAVALVVLVSMPKERISRGQRCSSGAGKKKSKKEKNESKKMIPTHQGKASGAIYAGGVVCTSPRNVLATHASPTTAHRYAPPHCTQTTRTVEVKIKQV
jgi:hypothetical protein